MKKLLCLFLCFAIVLAAVPAALAADPETARTLLTPGRQQTIALPHIGEDEFPAHEMILEFTADRSGWYQLDLSLVLGGYGTWYVSAETEDAALTPEIRRVNTFDTSEAAGTSLFFRYEEGNTYLFDVTAYDYTEAADGSLIPVTDAVQMTACAAYYGTSVGDAGPTITSSYNAPTNTLILTGTGSTWDNWLTTVSGHEWEQIPTEPFKNEDGELCYQGGVDRVIVGEGITHIGSDTFCDYFRSSEDPTDYYYTFGEIIFPSTLESITIGGITLYEEETAVDAIQFRGPMPEVANMFLFVMADEPETSIRVTCPGWSQEDIAALKDAACDTADLLVVENQLSAEAVQLDVNMDGSVNLKDVSALFAMLHTGEPCGYRTDIIDPDGLFNLKDVAAVYQAICG